MDTSNLQLNTEQFPIKHTKKLAEQFLHNNTTIENHQITKEESKRKRKEQRIIKLPEDN